MSAEDKSYAVGVQTENVADYGNNGLHITKSAFLDAKEDAVNDSQRPRWEVIRHNAKTCLIIAVVQTNGIILGLEYVLLGALVGVQAFCRTMGSYDDKTQAYAVAAWTLSLWAGLFGLMQFLGQMFAGWFSDRFGRTKTIYLMILFVYLGVMTEVLSQNRNDYTGAKIIMGVATGMMQVAIPSYVAEITPREIRGVTVGCFAFYLTLGSLIGSITTWACNEAWGANPFDDRGWRVPLYVGLATPTLTLIGMLLLAPESPYWLVLKDRVEDAKNSLRKLHPHASNEEIERIVNEVEYTVIKEREHAATTADATYLECVSGANLRRTFSAMFPSLSQQLVGNQLVQSYSTYFFTIAKITDALLGSVIVSIVGLAAAVVAFFLIDTKKVGRWNLVFYGVIGITLSMLGIGITDSAAGESASSGGAYVAFLALFNAATAIGPGVAGWAYAGEVGSARLRAKTTTLATGMNAIIGTVTNIVIPFELVAIGPNTGYMFFGIGLICIALVWLWIPDVTGRSYAQLDELFERRIPARKFKDTVCTGDYVPQ